MLPTGYKVPEGEKKNDGYLNKFEEGDTRIRILSEIKPGFEWWIDENGNNIGDRQIQKGDKPVRVKSFEDAAAKADSEPFKHFWVMTVYNYKLEKVQILEIKQKKIMSAIETLEADEDWGDSRNYDLVIHRTGKTFNDTEYQVNPKPAKPLSEEVREAVLKAKIDLDVWFDGGNPFDTKKEAQKAPQTQANDEVEDVSDSIPF